MIGRNPVFSYPRAAEGNREHLSKEFSKVTPLQVDGVVKVEAGEKKKGEAGAECLRQQGQKCRSREENQINM